jgi:CRISPR/Cas system-associated exonuclease Cas4 (RecB family)
MNLPDGFQFSQSSLQDFVDCPRRFQLRYLWRLAWPALETQPALEYERFLKQGETFHRMVQQYLVGLPAERLKRLIGDQDLARWWDSFLQFVSSEAWRPVFSAGRKYPEISLSAPLDGCRLVAKYDLILLQPEGQALIIDWKTTHGRRPSRRWLAARMQTRLYPYVLVRAGACLNQGQPFLPEKVEMLYWFADAPQQVERFPYHTPAYSQDEAYFSHLIATIRSLDEGDFARTEDERRCAFCVYRSLCERGLGAASLAEADGLESEADFELTLDFEQIAEIEF